MIHIVYKTVHLPSGHYYIGVHSSHTTDGYLGSGHRIKRMVAKYGRDQFQRHILSEHQTRLDALLEEYAVVTSDILLDPLCLNLTIGGKGNPSGGHGISDESRQRLSELHKGKQLSLITKQRISSSKKGRCSPLRGVKRSDETRRKISESRKGCLTSDITKQKIRTARLGVPRSKETKQRISEATKGKKMTEQAKLNMRKPKPKATCPQCGQVGGISSMKRWHFANCQVKFASVTP